MARIDVLKDAQRQLTIIDVNGPVTAKEIVEVIKAHNKEAPKHVLWDLTAASYDDLTTPDIEGIVRATQEFFSVRTGGKTAVVTATQLGFGLSRMFGLLQSVAQSHIHHGSFTSRESALQWLMEE